MTYAILQADGAPATTEQFKLAYRALKQFTAADAVKFARQSAGVLAKHLSVPDAALLQQAFQAQGIAAEAVPQAQLPALANVKFTKRVEFQPEALMVYDVIGRAVPVEWTKIEVIAAGIVPRVNTVSVVEEVNEIVFGGELGVQYMTETTVRHRLETDSVLTLDLIVAGGAMRFQMEGDSLLFKYAFDRPELDARQKFAELARQIIQRAPGAQLNRGATQLRDGTPLPALYANKVAFADESAWLLWRASRKSATPQ